MTDYITNRGTIRYDLAEPFIWLLAEHEHEVFVDRIDEIKSKRCRPSTIVMDTEVALLTTNPNLDHRDLEAFQTQNTYKELIYQKKVAKVSRLINKGENHSRKYKKSLIGRKLFENDVEDPELDGKRKRKNRAHITVSDLEKNNLEAKVKNLFIAQISTKDDFD